MNKIGHTLAGSVVVEMTTEEYSALERLMGQPHAPAPVPSTPGIGTHQMTLAERVPFVAERLRKLGPKKLDAGQRSIEAMFQFTGGITPTDLDAVVKALVKQRFFSIDPSGKVSYPTPR